MLNYQFLKKSKNMGGKLGASPQTSRGNEQGLLQFFFYW